MKLFRSLSSWICCNTVNTNCILNPTLVKDFLILIKKDPSPDVNLENQASCGIICSSTKGRVTGIVWGKPALNFLVIEIPSASVSPIKNHRSST